VGEISELRVAEHGFLEVLQGKKIVDGAMQEALGPYGPKASGMTFPP
jgi:hypothetical protein